MRVSMSASENTLWDDDHEGNLRIGVWGSWGAHRLITKAALALDDSPSSAVPIGPFTLPTSDLYRGDEHVWCTIMASSHYSGDAELDKEQHQYVARDIPVGVVAIPLTKIITFLRANDGAVHRTAVYQNHAFDVDQRPKADRSAAYKGILLLQFLRYNNGVFPVYTPVRGELLYGTKEQRSAEERMMNLLRAEYGRQFMLDSPDPGVWKPVDDDAKVSRFHITEWESDAGILPPVAYLQHDMDYGRELPEKSDWSQYSALYRRTIEDAMVAEQGLRATWAAAGTSVAESLAAIDAQLTQSNSDASISPHFIVVLRNLVDYAREYATALHYTRDYFYANRTTRAPTAIDLDSAVGVRAPSVPASFCPASRTTARSDGYTAVDPPSLAPRIVATEGAFAVPKETGCENWSTTPVTGMANACDCDEGGMIIHHVLELIPEFESIIGATAPTDGSDPVPLLRALVRVSKLFIPFVVQGLVTTAFVDSSGKQLMASQVRELPLRHSPEFRKQFSSGHFWAMFMTRTQAARLLERGGHNVTRDLRGLVPRGSGAWEERFPVMICEGTATSDVFLLPAGEYAPLIFKDAAVATAYIEEERSRRGQLAILRQCAPTLFEQLKLYQPPQFIDKAPNDDQTLTPFYRYVSLLQSSVLYRMNPRYGHLRAVDTRVHAQGCYIVDFLRSAFDNGANGAALRAIYADLSYRQWSDTVAPVMATVQNQLPLSIVARSRTPQERDMLMRQQGHRLGANILASLSKVGQDPALVRTALDRHAIGQERNLGRSRKWTGQRAGPTSAAAPTMDLLPSFTALRDVPTVPARGSAVTRPVTNKTPVIGYIEPWILQNPERAAKIQAELTAMHASGTLEHVAFLRNRRLPQSDDQITMRASIKL